MPPTGARELDEITTDVHRRERSLCADGRDTAPQPEGNYPLETLLVALKRRRLCTRFVPLSTVRARGRSSLTAPHAVGFIVGTGTHYLAIVRRSYVGGMRADVWQLVDNGRAVTGASVVVDARDAPTANSPDPSGGRRTRAARKPSHPSPYAILARLPAPPRVVVVICQPKR